MPDLVVRATLRDNVLPQLARIEAGIAAAEKSMSASNKRMSDDNKRNSDKTQKELFKIDNAMRGVGRRMASRVLLIGAAIAGVPVRISSREPRRWEPLSPPGLVTRQWQMAAVSGLPGLQPRLGMSLRHIRGHGPRE